MSGIIRVTAIGNLGADPEIRHTDNSIVANFSIASSESYTSKSSGEKITNTEWLNVVIWGKLAEVVEMFLKKGSKVYVEGKLRTRSWDDKDGNKRHTTEAIVSNLVMLDKKESQEDDLPY